MRNVVQQSFVVFTIGEKLYTVVYQNYMKENVVSCEISIQNKAEMSYQMERRLTYFRIRVNDSIRLFANSENNETLLYDISHLLLLPAPELYKRMFLIS